MNVYYQTISTIIKNAQRTKIDPDSYLDLTKLNMEEFISTIKQDNQIISGNIDAIKQNVEQILTDTKDIKNNSRMFSGYENVTKRNVAIPIGYGRLKIGSIVISNDLQIKGVIDNPAGGNLGGSYGGINNNKRIN